MISEIHRERRRTRLRRRNECALALADRILAPRHGGAELMQGGLLHAMLALHR